MSKDRKKLLHIHSSVYDKQPTPESLELGELGVNNASGNTFISTKNSANEVVRFSEDDTIVNWMDAKEVFPYEGRVRGISGDSVSGLTEEDLLSNKSNIVLKINQVAAKDSVHDTDINGATDIYGNLVNPFDEQTLTEGAGIAIDMSSYALVGGNPSFSSVTTEHGATFNGYTNVKGDEFNVDNDYVDIKASSAITIGRIGVNSQISGNTVDKAIEEVFDRSKVTSALTSTAEADYYKLYQDGNEVAEIEVKKLEIPKHGTLCFFSGGTFEEKEYNPLSGDAYVNVPTDAEHIKWGNASVCSTGETLSEKLNDAFDNVRIHLSAETITPESGEPYTLYTLYQGSGECITSSVNFAGGGGGASAPTCVSELDRHNISFSAGAFSDTTEKYYDPGKDCANSAQTVYIPTEVGHISRGTLKFEQNGSDIGEYDPAVLSGTTIEIPVGVSCVNELDRHMITFQAGSTSGFTNQTYDPGKDCANSAETINIPTSVCDLNRGILTLTQGDAILGEYDPCERKTIDITPSELVIEHNGLSAITYAPESGVGSFSHAVLTIEYGATSGKSRSVEYDTSDALSATIPTKVTHLENDLESITFSIGNTSISGSPYNGSESANVVIPSDAAHISWNTAPTCFSADSLADGITKIYNKSKVSMKTETGTTESGDVYTKYILYQDLSGSCQHTIGSIIAGGGGGSTGLERFYVEYTDVKDKDNYIVPDDESTVYIPKLVEHLGGRGILEFEHNGETVTYDPAQPSSGHVLPHSALTVNYGGNVSGISESSVTYDTSSGRTITIPTHLSGITHGILTFNGAVDDVYDPAISSGTTITIPNVELKKLTIDHNGEFEYDPEVGSAMNLSHSALTVNYGGSVSGISTSSVTYNTSSSRTITIPTHLSGITHGLLTFNGAVDGTYDLASGATVTIPNVELKKLTIDHNGEFEYDPKVGSAMNLSHSNLIVNYGGNLSDVSESSVTYNTSDGIEITIPTSVGDITHGDLTINYDGKKHMSYMSTPIIYDPSVESGKTIDVPVNVGQLTRGKFTIMVNSGQSNSASTIYDPSGDTKFNIDIPESYNEKLTIAYGNSGNTIGSYNPASGNTITVPSAETCNSPLVVRYGLEDMDDYDGYEESAYTPCEGGTIYIPTKIQDITNSAITYNTGEDCISISKNICMEGHTIVATSFYSTSDRNLKENIQSLLSMDAEKADEVHFKTFNFKDDETKTKTYGVIAQEVEGCGLNEIVHKDDNGNLSVDYISLLILKIANLENKVEELQSKVSELEKNNKQEGNN